MPKRRGLRGFKADKEYARQDDDGELVCVVWKNGQRQFFYFSDQPGDAAIRQSELVEATLQAYANDPTVKAVIYGRARMRLTPASTLRKLKRRTK